MHTKQISVCLRYYSTYSIYIYNIIDLWRRLDMNVYTIELDRETER